jgi:hypothetical protein
MKKRTRKKHLTRKHKAAKKLLKGAENEMKRAMKYNHAVAIARRSA